MGSGSVSAATSASDSEGRPSIKNNAIVVATTISTGLQQCLLLNPFSVVQFQLFIDPGFTIRTSKRRLTMSFPSASTSITHNPRLRFLNALRTGSKPIATFLGLPSFRTAQVVAQTGLDVRIPGDYRSFNHFDPIVGCNH